NIRLTGVALPVDISLHCQYWVTQYKREVVSAGHQTSPSQLDSAIPVTPPTPGPGSLAAGSSPRRAGRNVVRLHVRRGISSARTPLAAALRGLKCRRQFRNPAIWPVEGTSRRCHIGAIPFYLGETAMVEPGSPLLAFSEHAAELVERAAGSIVAVHGGGH